MTFSRAYGLIKINLLKQGELKNDRWCKVGDRVIDYLANKEAQTLRDENQALRLAASQSAQNEVLKSYVSGQFAYYNPRPVPSYGVPAPYPYCYNGGCGCGGSF